MNNDVSSEDLPLFYCSGNEDDCLHPRLLTQMKFGCVICKESERVTYDGLPKTILTGLPPEQLHNLWSIPFAMRPKCPNHPFHVLVPFCPNQDCGRPIDKDGDARPISIFGGVHAGKTVYCATLAHLVDQGNFFRLAKMAHSFPVGQQQREDYFNDVVEPLRNRGLQPTKTYVGEHHHLVMKLAGTESWPNRTLSVTDLAGEVWQFKENDQSTDFMRAAASTLLFSRECIFLLNPMAARGASGIAQAQHQAGGPRDNSLVDLTNTQATILSFMHSQGYLDKLNTQETLAAISALRLLFTQLEEYIQTSGYPTTTLRSDDNAYKLAENLMSVIQINLKIPRDQFGGKEATQRLADRLVTAAKALISHPSYLSQLNDLVNYMSTYGPGPGEYRLSVIVSKADLLEGIIDADLLLEDEELPPDSWPSSTLEDWWAALQNLSSRGREALINLQEEQFVKVAEDNFKEVGFFFCSSLGRPTEVLVERRPGISAQPMVSAQPGVGAPHGSSSPLSGMSSFVAQSPQSNSADGDEDDDAWNDPGDVQEEEEGEVEKPAGPVRSKDPIWALRKRISGDNGSHQPRPRGVLPALLWLMAGNR